MITGYGTLRHELSLLNHFQPQQGNTSWLKYRFELSIFTIGISFPHIVGCQANVFEPAERLILFCSYFIVRILYILRKICSLEIHLSETLAHMLIMTDQSQIKGKTVSSVPIYKGPYSITRSKMRKKFFFFKTLLSGEFCIWFEGMFDTHLGKYLNEVISNPLTCFVVVSVVLLANLFQIIEDMLNSATTGSPSLFLKLLKLSSKESFKYYKILA